MNITEEMKPDIEELDQYSSKLFSFIIDNFEFEINQLSQIEFNCLFKVYNDKINFICDKYNLSEDEIASISLNDEKFNELTECGIDGEDAVDLFMEYVNNFVAQFENMEPSLIN